MNGTAHNTGVNPRIPFLDIKRAYLEIEEEVKEAIGRVFRNGIFILGPEVEAFENEWADFCGTGACASTGNGTNALELALIASGAVRRGFGDEVITSPLTAGYTAVAIVNAGGVPVFADIDPDTCLITPETIEAAITRRTRAVVPVHLYGQMADMKQIVDLAGRHNLRVIEDAAQAHGAGTGRERPGALSQAAVFSFYPTKNLGAFGDGGAVISNDDRLIDKIKVLRQGGHATAIAGDIAGMNSRLDEFHAAMLRVKLRRLDDWNRKRRGLAKFYFEALNGSLLKLPHSVDIDSHAWHLYIVQHSDRDGLRERLAEQGIETLIHYPFLLHQQTLFRRAEQIPLPVAESVVGKILSLPLYPQLKIEEAQEVVDSIREYEERIRNKRK